MLVVLQALAFAGCVLVDLLPSTEVDCRFSAPIAVWGTPPAVAAPGVAECRAPEPSAGDVGAQCLPTG